MFQQRKLAHLFSQVWCIWNEHILKSTCARKGKTNFYDEKTVCKLSRPYPHNKKHNNSVNRLYIDARVVWKYLQTVSKVYPKRFPYVYVLCHTIICSV